jgi:cytoskeletal protein RodZ
MIHTELGDQLRRAREDKGLTLEEVEKATGIRKRFLQAMEEGRFDALPSEIQLRGFLKNYANHVGLNGEEMLAVYERRTRPGQTAAAQKPASPVQPAPVRPAAPQPVKPQSAPTATSQPARPAEPVAPPSSRAIARPKTVPQPAAPKPQLRPTSTPVAATRWMSRLPSWLTLEMVLIAIAVLMVICVAVLIVLLLTNPSNTPATAPRPVTTRTRAAPSPPAPTLPPETPVSTTQPNITTSAEMTSTADFVQVSLAATEHVWVRVTTDGKTAFEGMFAPGQALKWEAKEMLIVETGNGAGLTASFNNKPVGVLGPRDQLVARAWTPAGETAVPPKPTALLPTPSPTP